MSKSPSAREREQRALLRAHASEFRRLRDSIFRTFDYERIEQDAGPTVAACITELRAELGTGPTWQALATRVKVRRAELLPQPPGDANSRLRYLWNHSALSALLPLLRAAGWVSYTDAPHSLDLGPRAPAHRVTPAAAATPSGCMGLEHQQSFARSTSGPVPRPPHLTESPLSMLTSLIRDSEQLSFSDHARRWGVTLIDPTLPLDRIVRDDRTMRRVCIEDKYWAPRFLGGLLATIVNTLPANDPWRHLAVRLDGCGDFPAIVRDVPTPPRRTGALLPDGRQFSGPDHPRFAGSDPELDADFAALAGGLSPDAAALFAVAADGWAAAERALSLIRVKAVVHAGIHGTPDGSTTAEYVGDHVWSTATQAIRWAIHRRRLLHAARPAANITAGNIPNGGADEASRDIAWQWATLTDDFVAGTADESDFHVAFAHMVKQETLPQPTYWPTD